MDTPVIVYDGECNFCRQVLEDMPLPDKYTIEPYSAFSLEELPKDYDSCFHIYTGSEWISCGDALRKLTEENTGIRLDAPVFRVLFTGGYKMVSENRTLASKLYSMLNR